jgi:hypothetical protein
MIGGVLLSVTDKQMDKMSQNGKMDVWTTKDNL